jgi:hypothetical protein
MKDQIIRDISLRIILDDVGTPESPEYRASLYDQSLALVAEGWGDTLEEATNWAVGDLLSER